ncbi:hypothetical protein GW17_00054790 [Ensete ventricosum]|uniref:Uncharacterized protein n=1 Tax=Ensete ventricosum TaxID=4639 RepID=A0A444CCF3_ENSVE|nr:hypothetical protein B296_00001207 [Ensete ventricosum]RWV83580.1 hypothetical protein GW17_00054790 [Ensete ventricosum]RZR92666.1 hypothetical protein BHM03_00021031 [Ensete ventricosum]
MITVSSGRSRDQTKKGRTTASSKKEMATRVCQPNDDEPRKPITKASASVLRLGRKDQQEEETQETKMDTEYSMSPPPSSLPLPSFALTRLRTAANGGGGGCGATHSGATDELRRLLRL